MTHPTRNLCLAVLSILFLVSAVYWDVGGFTFVHCDDGLYVRENPWVQKGLTVEGFRWAFTTTHAANWHPMTWLSHMLDVEWFGMDAGWHHRVNVLLHLGNTLLLFLMFRRMTGELWQSAFVAALFGVHPLHVESVTWVAERKDVLSTFFWFLTFQAYIGYVRKPVGSRYLVVMACFIPGLLSKPMVVTLPFVLLLLDWWPLGRMTPSGGSGEPGNFSFPDAFYCVREKVPMFLLTAASCALTYAAQHREGAVASLQSYPFTMRAANAAVAYVSYLAKTAWPASLAVFYPYPAAGHPVWKVAAAVLLLSAMSWITLRASRKRPWLGVGWLWYLGTLVPVIGLVQVGDQSMADRYTYVPLVGIFLMVAWEGGRIMEGWRYHRLATGAVAVGIVLSLAAVARIQAGYWKDSTTLFTRALEATENNHLAWNNLGLAYQDLGQQAKSLHAYREALRIKPDYVPALNNLGNAYGHFGANEKALNFYLEALRVNPGYAVAWNNLGLAYWTLGQPSQAIRAYREALARDPMYALAWANLGNVYASLNQQNQAIPAYREAIRISPSFFQAWCKLGETFFSTGDYPQAIGHFREAVRIRPDYAEAWNNLGKAHGRLGQFPQAIASFREALRIRPDNPEVLYNLGGTYALSGQREPAREIHERLVRVDPGAARAFLAEFGPVR